MFIIKQIDLDSGVTISEQYCNDKQKAINIANNLYKHRTNKILVLDLYKHQGYGFRIVFSLPQGRTFESVIRNIGNII